MNFAYEGFTNDHSRRCFTFRGIDDRNTGKLFSIEVDLTLFAQNKVPVQEGPMFCLQLLTAASLAGSDSLGRFERYTVLAEDFRPLLQERAKRAAEKALKKPSRSFGRKPAGISNIHLSASARQP